MFSQHKEEQHILAAFEGNTTGRFLDIGAFNPTLLSNTRALYLRGWSGVMVEMSPGPMHSLLAEYGNESRITLIQAAVALEHKLMEFQVTDDALSTSVAAEREKWAKAEWFGKMLVPTITLEDIQYQFGGFDFINIDVEGGSVDLFLRAMKLKWVPRCICCEIDNNRTTEILASATACGYQAVWANQTNIILVRSEK